VWIAYGREPLIAGVPSKRRYDEPKHHRRVPHASPHHRTAWESKPCGCHLAGTSRPAAHGAVVGEATGQSPGLPSRCIRPRPERPCCEQRSAGPSPGSPAMPLPPAADLRRPHWRRERSPSCGSLCAAESLCRRMRPTVLTSRPLAGWRQTRTSVGVISCFKTHRPLRSTRFHGLHRSYEAIRLLLWHRTLVVAFSDPTVSGPEEISWGKDE